MTRSAWARRSRTEPARPVAGAMMHVVVSSEPDVPLVGRERKLTILRAAVTSASDGNPGAVLVAGEAGGGKTRLVRALLEDSPSQGGTRPAGAVRRPGRSGSALPGDGRPDRPEHLQRRARRRVATTPALRRDGGPARGSRIRGPVVVTVEDLHCVDSSRRTSSGSCSAGCPRSGWWSWRPSGRTGRLHVPLRRVKEAVDPSNVFGGGFMPSAAVSAGVR